MLRLLLLDEQRMFVEALGQCLSTVPDLWVAGSADPAQVDLPDKAAATRPDVIMIDVAPFGARASEVLRFLSETSPASSLVVLASQSRPALAVEAARAGVIAWVPKERGIAELVTVIRGASRGEGWYPPEVLGMVLRSLREDVRSAAAGDGPLDVLSSRERDVLAGMVAGKRAWRIAEELFISVQTVRTHTRSILGKLNVHSQLEAVTLARSVADTAAKPKPVQGIAGGDPV
ncbi:MULTISPECIES: response regulator transcription factor [unclassified Actinopolyspora]|uniref:LuxR C-terminal-related transcriptional regulator n=1 Tax=unclassified Actinopolyspora TaxID=2639451 RepID=UPI0013F5A794|nr:MULTISPECIES: response regulator transcription factor [unclassified Actinopolyspora]NHD16908.1 response regulator transcription factor [Actinopolyspora sp. BKK2]NHE76060.1 response regulator transcription factor [Actinopolyspora sp. BKK1]